MVRMDVTDTRYPDRSFDVIYCSHVLVHVPDDRKAMDAGFRVEVTGVHDLVAADEAERMGLKADHGTIYYCTK